MKKLSCHWGEIKAEINVIGKLEKLLRERILYYQRADIKVNLINTSKENMSNILLKQINEYLSIKNYEN